MSSAIGSLITWRNADKATSLVTEMYSLYETISRLKSEQPLTKKEQSVLMLKTFRVVFDFISLVKGSDDIALQCLAQHQQHQAELRPLQEWLVYYTETGEQEDPPLNAISYLTPSVESKRSVLQIVNQAYRACYSSLFNLEGAGLSCDLGLYYAESKGSTQERAQILMKTWSRLTRMVGHASKRLADDSLNPHTTLSKVSQVSWALHATTNVYVVGQKVVNQAKQKGYCVIV
jgi:hypothetical protein